MKLSHDPGAFTVRAILTVPQHEGPTMDVRWSRVGQAVAVGATLAFLGVLACLLSKPGYSTTRLGFFAILGGFAVIGVVGVVRNSTPAVAVASLGLLLLGIWQAVLGIFVLPMVGVLLMTHLFEALDGESVSPDLQETPDDQ